MTEVDTFIRLKRIPFKDMVAVIVNLNVYRDSFSEEDWTNTFRINGWTREEYYNKLFRRRKQE